LIPILEEDCLATNSALGHVVRKTRDDHADEPTHPGKISRTQVNRYAVTGLPWSLLAKNERNAIESTDLHFRWSMLAVDYQRIWADVFRVGARSQLAEAQEREALLSKSSTMLPDNEGLMGKCQDNVVMHHRSELVDQEVA
jgi:hypothetical protein